MERDIATMTKIDGKLTLNHLHEIVLKYIFLKCNGKDIGRLSKTCRYFYTILLDDIIWRQLCFRDFKLSNPDMGCVKSYRQLYTNLLHRYGLMLGVYVSCSFSSVLSEIRYNAGCIECVNWESKDNSDIEAPLVEEVVFRIHGDTSTPAIYCFPDGLMDRTHSCSVTFNKVRGVVHQQCMNSEYHASQPILSNRQEYSPDIPELPTLRRCYFEESGFLLKPLLLPSRDDVPNELKNTDGTLPPHLISPGLFLEYVPYHNMNSRQILCFRYKNECEIHGLKVAGDADTGNHDDDRISLKILVRDSVSPTLQEQLSFGALLVCQGESRPPGVSQEQPFLLPEDCEILSASVPDSCRARYSGFLRDETIHSRYYLKVHVVIFSDDLFGVLMLETRKTFLTYQRIQQKFTSNLLTNVESVV